MKIWEEQKDTRTSDSQLGGREKASPDPALSSSPTGKADLVKIPHVFTAGCLEFVKKLNLVLS